MSQQINLFNPAFRKQKQHFSAVTILQGVSVIAIGVLGMSAFTAYQLAQMSKAAAQRSSLLVATQAQLDNIGGAGPRPKSKVLEDQIQQVEAEVKSLQLAFDTLQKGDFGNTKGYSEYMRAFSRQIIDGIWLTGFTIQGAGSGIALQGRTLQAGLVPTYIGRLKHEQVMKGKSFAMLEMHTPQVEQPAKDNQAAKQVTAGYIEFVLQSAAVQVDQPEPKNR